ncbi:MAG: GNAT family N-acetyltransferase [Flavobacteriaceae bacterium]|nr:GNAT family N-acetyltransferase [Flavobacteriaceae bacterium]
MITIQTKTFQELTTKELYDILQLRVEVFCVEQNCVYQDLDGKDEKALHVIGKKNDKIIAYTRVFKPGDYFEEASIGRVVVHKEERQHKYGYDIMEASIKAVSDYFKVTTIKLSAQTYLRKFYNNLGFKEIGEEYLEDGIPHIAMIKS